eukprot:jgi/Chrzof1/8551/Cz03g15110.t1
MMAFQQAGMSAAIGTAAAAATQHQPAELKGAEMPSALSSVTSSSSPSSRRQAVGLDCGLARLPKEVIVDIIRRAALPLSCWATAREYDQEVSDPEYQYECFEGGKLYYGM